MPGLNHPQSNDDFYNRTTFPPPHLIQEFDDYSNSANVFYFGAFADKILGVVFNDCTGNFSYMSLDGNIYFFVIYHYKTDTILITPMVGLDSKHILEAYKSNFQYLVSKGFKPKVNMMDNQATKNINAYLTPQQVTLQLVEPHNHRVNAVEQAIQKFKNRLVDALGTTDRKFPIQLWGKLAPKVQDCINFLQCSRITPDKLAYKTLEGPYNINWYPVLCTRWWAKNL
jgi:hypothetical protein